MPEVWLIQNEGFPDNPDLYTGKFGTYYLEVLSFYYFLMKF